VTALFAACLRHCVALMLGRESLAAESWLPDNWHKQGRRQIQKFSFAIAQRRLYSGKNIFWWFHCLCDLFSFFIVGWFAAFM